MSKLSELSSHEYNEIVRDYYPMVEHVVFEKLDVSLLRYDPTTLRMVYPVAVVNPKYKKMFVLGKTPRALAEYEYYGIKPIDITLVPMSRIMGGSGDRFADIQNNLNLAEKQTDRDIRREFKLQVLLASLYIDENEGLIKDE